MKASQWCHCIPLAEVKGAQLNNIASLIKLQALLANVSPKKGIQFLLAQVNSALLCSVSTSLSAQPPNAHLHWL